jgi:hypothetical protein
VGLEPAKSQETGYNHLKLKVYREYVSLVSVPCENATWSFLLTFHELECIANVMLKYFPDAIIP